VLARPRQHDGDAVPRNPLRIADDRRMSDGDTGHIGDRIVRTRRVLTDGDAEFSQPWSHRFLSSPAVSRGRFTGRCYGREGDEPMDGSFRSR